MPTREKPLTEKTTSQLQEELAKKTAELEQKNRELEIESSLEKVRVIALAMRKAADMPEICKTISKELATLGVKEIRNVQTAIFHEEKGTYFNFEYYAKHDKTVFTETEYRNHPLHNEFAQRMLKGAGEVFIRTISKKELPDWIKYQKTTNVFIDSFLETASSLTYYWHSLGPVALGMSTYELLNEEEIELFKRFKKVFELSYRRYLDIEKAEAQAHESQIETSLERVRAVALGMRTPDDLLNICETLFHELLSLGFSVMRNAMINIHDDEKGTFVNYDYSEDVGKTVNQLTYNIHPVIENQIRKIRSAHDAFSETVFEGKELEEWKKFRKEVGEPDDPRVDQTSSLHYYLYSIGNGSIGISAFSSLSEAKVELLKRFRNVFEFAYKRFSDIALAEAQAKEAKLEASLEKVRAQAMAMHTTEELKSVGETIYHELESLGFSDIRNTEIIINHDEKQTIVSYYCDYGVCGTIEVGYKTNPILHQWANDLKKASDAFVPVVISEKEMPGWRKFREEIGYLPDEKLNAASSVYYYSYSTGLGALSVSSFIPASDEQMKMLERFRNVFALAYRRYVDVALAEAQAREAQIQLALERVRARTMAMQRSDELMDAAIVLFQQIKSLGVDTGSCGFNIWEKDEKSATVWMSSAEGRLQEPFKLVHTESEIYNDVYQAARSRKDFLVKEVRGEALKKHFDYLLTVPGIGSVIKKLKETNYSFPESLIYHFAFFNQGYLSFHLHESRPETHDIFKRFANVFEQTYTRFLDLQKAEEQANEAKIEAALERVRSRTMGMQRSEELREVIQIVYEQLVHLNIQTDHTGFILDYKTRDDFNSWIADQFGTPSQVTIPYFDSIYYNRFNEAKEKGIDFFATTLTLEEKNSFYTALFKHVPGFPEESKKIIFSQPGFTISTVLMEDVALYIENFSGIPYSDEENATLLRFGKVFQQTYTRFLDLQKAEAQARESQIELALERVRARTMAMQRSDELIETTSVLFEQFKQLGENVEQISIGIFNEEEYTIEVSATYHSSPLKKIFKAQINDWPLFEQIYTVWKSGAKSGSVELKGKELHDYNRYRSELSDTKFGSEVESPDDRWIINMACFSKGIISFSKGEPAQEETIQLLERFGKVFDLTYTRFLDLQKAEAQAHEAQIEASLERVRASAMAMHNSDDLTGAAGTVFTELNKLGIHSIRSGFVLLTRESRRAKLYPATSFDKAITLSFTGEFDFIGHPVFEKQYESWLKQENYFPVLEGETLVSYYRLLSEALSVSFDQYLETDKQFGCFLPFTDGFLFTWNMMPVSEEEIAILSRFKTILDLTIRRYADLKKAEALVAQSLIEERKLREEKERADKLLLNILPEEIANELKQFGKSYARKHDEVTILFADIQGFSSIAETLSAQELVTQLDECFRAFDHIMDKHGLEKIKTVGDAYVAAAGLPKPVNDHALRTVRAAIDMMNFIKGFSITRTIQDLPAFDFRIGIHTGPVVTGVVGLKKFTYDIWGDAVNMAARMEQHGEAGKVNISESTYALVKDKFKCAPRGKIPAKNKGEVEMYFVEG